MTMEITMPAIPLDHFNEIVNDAIRKEIEEKKKTLPVDVLEKIEKLEELRNDCREWIETVKKEKNEFIQKTLKEYFPSLMSTGEMICREIADSALLDKREDGGGYTTIMDRDWIELRKNTVSNKAMEFLYINSYLQQFINILDKYLSLMGDCD